MNRSIIALFAVGLLASCGGGGSSSSGTGGRGGSVGTTPTPANPPATVNVNAGLTAGGININVPAPQSSPTPNATLLGASVVPAGGGSVSITLTSTGATVHRGDSVVIGLIGDGISSNMTVTISGPDDISVNTTSLKSFTADNGKPGVSFQAQISPNAALGARSVFLKNAQDDITSFTGGLEVVP